MRMLPTLPEFEPAAGWSHPYPRTPLSPYLYADGGAGEGDDGGSDDQDDETDDGADKGSDDDRTDWKAEAERARADAEKWKAQSRKHETRAKENAGAARERDQLKREGMPEQERKIEEAVGKALAEERAKTGGKLARQAFLAAAKGVIPNAGDVADDVNLGRYVSDDGEVDEDGLAELVKRLAPKSSGKDDQGEDDAEDERDTRRRGGRGFDQGTRGGRSKERRQASVAAGRDLWAERHPKKTTT